MFVWVFVSLSVCVNTGKCCLESPLLELRVAESTLFAHNISLVSLFHNLSLYSLLSISSLYSLLISHSCLLFFFSTIFSPLSLSYIKYLFIPFSLSLYSPWFSFSAFLIYIFYSLSFLNSFSLQYFFSLTLFLSFSSLLLFFLPSLYLWFYSIVCIWRSPSVVIELCLGVEATLYPHLPHPNLRPNRIFLGFVYVLQFGSYTNFLMVFLMALLFTNTI